MLLNNKSLYICEGFYCFSSKKEMPLRCLAAAVILWFLFEPLENLWFHIMKVELFIHILDALFFNGVWKRYGS